MVRYRETESPPLPSSRGRVGVLAIGGRDETGQPSALVYYGRERVRRIELSGGKPRRVWKRKLWQAPKRDACARVGDVVVFGGKDGGLEGVRLTTGEHVWLVKHPSRISAVPVVLPEGHLLVAFDDRTWMRIDPRSGKPLASGQTRDDLGAGELAGQGRHPPGVFRRLIRTARGHTIVGDAIAAGDGRRLALKGWTIAAIDVCGDRVVAALRSIGDSQRLGAAVIDSGGLETSGVIDLGDWPSSANLDGTSEVDACIQLSLADRVHVIDPELAREVIRIDERGAAVLMADGRRITWRGRL